MFSFRKNLVALIWSANQVQQIILHKAALGQLSGTCRGEGSVSLRSLLCPLVIIFCFVDFCQLRAGTVLKMLSCLYFSVICSRDVPSSRTGWHSC